MRDFLLLSALIGATLIVVRGTIFRRMRAVWPAFLACSQCVGFWVGVGAGATSIVSLGYGRWFDTALMGCAVSALAMVTDIVLLKIADGPAEAEEQRR